MSGTNMNVLDEKLQYDAELEGVEQYETTVMVDIAGESDALDEFEAELKEYAMKLGMKLGVCVR